MTDDVDEQARINALTIASHGGRGHVSRVVRGPVLLASSFMHACTYIFYPLKDITFRPLHLILLSLKTSTESCSHPTGYGIQHSV